MTTPSLALSVFRLDPKPDSASLNGSKALSPDTLNDLNRSYYARISARKDILLTQTVLNGAVCIRFAVGAARTEDVHVRKAYQLLCKEGKSTLEGWRKVGQNGNV